MFRSPIISSSCFLVGAFIHLDAGDRFVAVDILDTCILPRGGIVP